MDVVDSLNALGMEAGVWVYPASVDTTLLLDDARLPCWEENPPSGKPCFCENGSADLACQPWDAEWYAEYYDAPGCTGDYWQYWHVDTSGCPWLEDPSEDYLGEVCCAHEDSRAWVKAQLARLLDPDKYGLTYLKFDGGTHPCYATNHTHRMALFPGDTAELRAQDPCLGIGQILGELLSEYPGTIFQAGWPRGHMQEGEDVYEVYQVPYIARYSMESLRWYTLPQYTGTFLYGEPDVSALSLNEKAARRKYYVRTAMLSPFSISCDVVGWSAAFTNIVKGAIAYYKNIRPFLRGEVFSVVEQREFCAGGPCSNSWDAVQFLDPATGEARVFVFRADHVSSSWAVPLRGLDADSSYVVEGIESGPLGTFTGDSLMTGGVRVDLEYIKSSEILEVERESQ